MLAGVLGLVAISDISVPYDSSIYATHSSGYRGAVTNLPVPIDLSIALWLGGDKKGGYTMLDGFYRATLRTVGEDVDEDVTPVDLTCAPAKVIEFAFDFVEICGGSGVLGEALARKGYRVCPPIGRHHDMEKPQAGQLDFPDDQCSCL